MSGVHKKTSLKSTFLSTIGFIVLSLLPQISLAKVLPEILAYETTSRLSRVPEFKFIQQEANKLKIKVYLFGGTASAFGHYVRWDLEREGGDTKYQAEKFDYDFLNIYRGNQDLDLVVDGQKQDLEKFKNILIEKFPHFIGEKTSWELRLLREGDRDKLPLLNDYDFLNQHTDTNSTGLIAINETDPSRIYLDLFNWPSTKSDFLKDIANGEIHFLFSNNHEKTSRYKIGKNPPIFSALRYLAKLAQYEAQGTTRDLETIKAIIDKTDWDNLSEYVVHKLSEFALKTLLNSPNSEYAWNLLEGLGLRQKLIKMDGNRVQAVDTLSWWLNKEPLRSKPLGLGVGKKALEIWGEDIVVAHETNNFAAYENITRSSYGAANAFISRTSTSGESAAHGNGFYVRLGQEGARNTGLTIKFKLNPEAREGHDFIKTNSDYIVILNKLSISRIPEGLNLSPLEFLILRDENQYSFLKNKGFVAKLERRFKRLSSDSKEYLEAFEYIKNIIEIPTEIYDRINKLNLNYDFRLEPESNSSFEDLMNTHLNLSWYFTKFYIVLNKVLITKNRIEKDFLIKILSKTNENVYEYSNIKSNFEFFLKNSNWFLDHDVLNSIIENPRFPKTYICLIPSKAWRKNIDLVFKMIETSGFYSDDIYKCIFSDPEIRKHEKLLIHFVSYANINGRFNESSELISKSPLLQKKENLLIGLNSAITNRGYGVFEELLFKKIKIKPDDLLYLLKNYNGISFNYYIVNDFLKNADQEIYFESIKYLITNAEFNFLNDFASGVLKNYSPQSIKIAELIMESFNKRQSFGLIKNTNDFETLNISFISYVFSQPQWLNHPNFVKEWAKKSILEDKGFGIIYFFQYEHWKNHRLFDELIDEGYIDGALVKYVLSNRKWIDRPEVVENIIKSKKVTEHLITQLFANEQSPWSTQLELILLLIEYSSLDYDTMITEKIINKDFFTNNKIINQYLEGRPVTVKSIRERMQELSFSDWNQKRQFKTPPHSFRLNISGNTCGYYL